MGLSSYQYPENIRAGKSPVYFGLDGFLRRFSMARRSFLVGRPDPGSRDGLVVWNGVASGLGMGGLRSSYSSWASDAGPRRDPKATILTTLTRAPQGKVRTSPGRTKWLAFWIRAPLLRILPDRASLAAKDRLFTRRANQSHRSIRNPGSLDSSGVSCTLVLTCSASCP